MHKPDDFDWDAIREGLDDEDWDTTTPGGQGTAPGHESRWVEIIAGPIDDDWATLEALRPAAEDRGLLLDMDPNGGIHAGEKRPRD